ncbi:MAG: hypothetical protein IPL57_20065 [Rubrivivax sp.]|nr:hypothetical protein [Rubrivivax sp.]
MTTPDFAKMVPGFDFLQGLMKGAGAGLPSMSQWIAPTLDAEEVDKRIQELRTVQFWLEQNAKMLGATIQALEVQRMTLATLKTMNLPMSDLRDAMKLDPSGSSTKRAAAPGRPAPAPSPTPSAAAAPDTAPAAGMVDPLQWWSALTRQFSELAANAIKDSPVEAAKQMAGAAFKQVVQPLTPAAAKAKPARKAAAPAAPKAGARRTR